MFDLQGVCLATIRGHALIIRIHHLYFYAKEPLAKLEARIVFPYNPYHPRNFCENTIGHAKPLEAINEAWVQDDFWDLCTG